VANPQNQHVRIRGPGGTLLGAKTAQDAGSKGVRVC